MVRAEGGPSAFVRAVRISVPSCKDYTEARQIAVNTITHASWDYSVREGYEGFVQFLGNRWAPIGAANDPTHLNRNWIPNVIKSLPRTASQTPQQG